MLSSVNAPFEIEGQPEKRRGKRGRDSVRVCFFFVFTIILGGQNGPIRVERETTIGQIILESQMWEKIQIDGRNRKTWRRRASLVENDKSNYFQKETKRKKMEKIAETEPPPYVQMTSPRLGFHFQNPLKYLRRCIFITISFKKIYL